MIVVSSLLKLPQMMDQYDPGAVISILDNVEEVPELSPLPQESHLKIGLSMTEVMMGVNLNKEDQRVAKIIDFACQYDWTKPLLIHCQLGLTRSPAAAFIIECALSPNKDEVAFAREMRGLSKDIDLSMVMVTQADEQLGRKGRMIEAMEEMGFGNCSLTETPLELPFKPTMPAA